MRPAHWLFGHARELSRDPLTTSLRWMQHGDVVPFAIGRRRALCVTGPDAMQQVLEDRDGVFGKRTRGYDELSLFLGRGLLTSEGEAWKHSRRVVTAHLQPATIASVRPLVERCAARELEVLDAAAREGRALDLLPLATRVTLAVIGSVLVGVDLAVHASWMRECVTDLQNSANQRISSSYSLPLWVPLAAHRRAARAANAVRTYARRLAEQPSPGSLLDGCLRYRARDGTRIPPAQVEDEIVTFLLAGHESTANTLAWALYLLAGAREYDASCAEGRSPWLEAVFRETIRLYPQGWSFGRSVSRACTLGSVTANPGELVMLVPYATHRHPAHWSRPEHFSPERFVDPPPRHRCAFVPFSAGRRACVGAALATVEVVETLRVWLSRYRFERTGEVAAEPRITLRPKGGMWLLPHRR